MLYKNTVILRLPCWRAPCRHSGQQSSWAPDNSLLSLPTLWVHHLRQEIPWNLQMTTAIINIWVQFHEKPRAKNCPANSLQIPDSQNCEQNNHLKLLNLGITDYAAIVTWMPQRREQSLSFQDTWSHSSYCGRKDDGWILEGETPVWGGRAWVPQEVL